MARVSKLAAGVVAAAITVTICPSAQAARPRYVRTDLPALGDGTSYAVAINDAGVIAGNSAAPSSPMHAVVWTDGQLTDLGAAPGRQTSATAINSAGHVLGQTYAVEGPGRAFLWRDGHRVNLGTLGGPTSQGLAINDSDVVVGRSDTADGAEHAFVWQDGVMSDLGTLGGPSSVATSINNAGVIVGTADTTGRLATREPTAPVRWDGGSPTRLLIAFSRPPDGEGAPPRWRLLINDAGVIAGSVTGGGNSGSEDTGSRLFRWTDGVVTFAGPAVPNAYLPNAVNASGDVAAFRFICCADNSTGVVWLGDRLRTIHLPPGAGNEPHPFDINDSGLVVGENFSPSRQPVAFVRQPDGRTSVLASLDLESAATAVNASGTIAGWTATPETAQTACYWQLN